MKEIFSDSYFFFAKNFRQIATLCLPLLFIGAFLQYLFTNSESLQFISLPAYFLIYPVYTAALILLMEKHARQQFPENRELVSAALKVYRPMLLLSITAMALVAVGLMFLVIPGIWVAVRLAFAEFFVVLHGLSPKEAIRRSYLATKNHSRTILVALLTVVCPIWLMEYIAVHHIRGIFEDPIVRMITETIGSYLLLFSDVVIFRIFMEAVLKQPEQAG